MNTVQAMVSASHLQYHIVCNGRNAVHSSEHHMVNDIA